MRASATQNRSAHPPAVAKANPTIVAPVMAATVVAEAAIAAHAATAADEAATEAEAAIVARAAIKTAPRSRRCIMD
jgi:hypothetical protein